MRTSRSSSMSSRSTALLPGHARVVTSPIGCGSQHGGGISQSQPQLLLGSGSLIESSRSMPIFVPCSSRPPIAFATSASDIAGVPELIARPPSLAACASRPAPSPGHAGAARRRPTIPRTAAGPQTIREAQRHLYLGRLSGRDNPFPRRPRPDLDQPAVGLREVVEQEIDPPLRVRRLGDERNPERVVDTAPVEHAERRRRREPRSARCRRSGASRTSSPPRRARPRTQGGRGSPRPWGAARPPRRREPVFHRRRSIRGSAPGAWSSAT